MSGLEWCKAGWTIPSRKNNAITTFTVCQLDACLHSISFPTSLKKMKVCKKKRHLSLSVVTACLAFLEGWNHPFLSLQTENQNISPTCLLPSSALPHTAMFLPPALCPQSYLTLCHTFKRLENSWDALCSTLIFQNLHAPFWPKKTLQNLHHFATQLNSNI